MPIPVPYPTVDPTVYERGSLPVLTLSRGTVTLSLSIANGWVVLPGVEGLDDPPRTLISVDPATWDGSLMTGVRYAARDVFLPLHYAASDTATLRAAVRDLAVLLDVKRGPCTLEVAHADGARRTIDGWLSAPFGQALESREATLWRRVGVALRAPDPYFTGAEQTITWRLADDTTEFLSSTFLPVQVGDSQVGGTVIIDNGGDADAYPVWTVTGPCSDLTCTAADGATTFTVPAGLAEDETLVVDARRGEQTVTVDGAPAWDRVGSGALLGALAPGVNTLTVVASGAASTTTIAAAWTERWLTAW